MIRRPFCSGLKSSSRKGRGKSHSTALPDDHNREIDSDGDLDLVGASGSVVSSSPAIPLSWRENLDGLGTFGPAQLIDDVKGEVVVGDFDRDGDPDLAFRATGEYCASPLYIAVYENLGFGTFAPRRWSGISWIAAAALRAGTGIAVGASPIGTRMATSTSSRWSSSVVPEES